MSVDLLPHAAGSPRIGRYEVLGRLATGGMAEVYLACIRGPSAFEHAVVVKRILPHLADVSDFTAMFLDEARIAASIRHPNVVQVRELARDDDGLYLVMEYLHGESLSSVQRRLAARHEPMPPALAAWVVAEACAGLHAAHELRDASGRPKELVHRDVSPDNLFVTYDGSVKVVDFGIAKSADRLTKTETGQIKGKFQYMSPEQCAGHEVDRRSDIFSTGIVLFEMLTGHRLFKRDTRMATWLAVTQEPIPRASSFVPDLPAALESIVERALARDRDARYPTAQELRRDLLAFVRSVAGFELPEERLRARMHEIFGDRIEEKNELLRRMEEGRAVGALPSAETDEDVEIPSVVVPPRATTHVTIAAPTIVDRPPQRPRSALAAGLAALVVIGLGVAFAATRDATATPPVAAAPPSDAAPPAEVTLTVETDPPGADVSVDGVARGRSPLALRVARGTTPLAIVARAEGFGEARSDVVPEVSVLVRLPLVALPAPVAEPAPEPDEPPARVARRARRRASSRPSQATGTTTVSGSPAARFERFE